MHIHNRGSLVNGFRIVAVWVQERIPSRVKETMTRSKSLDEPLVDRSVRAYIKPTVLGHMETSQAK
jgi:hypothetical protein